MSNIRQSLSGLEIRITPEFAKRFNRMVIQFEVRKEHPLTLNGQLFGVHEFKFTPSDRAMLFEVVGVEEEQVAKIIEGISSIDNEFRVVSDAFNVLSIYLAHLVVNSRLPKNLMQETVVSILNYLQYRFMCSAVNHYFPHKANYDIMQTVIESLSMKSAIRSAGTWKKVIKNRSESVAGGDRQHQKILLKFDDDKEVLYLITDLSTKIRSQLRIITGEYYEVKETNQFIRSHSSTTELDGEKILREREGNFELMSSVVFHKLLHKHSFVDDGRIKMVQKSVERVNHSIIKRMLVTLSDEANYQLSEGTSKKVVQKRGGGEVYEGVEILISKIIEVIYSNAIRHGSVNIRSKISVYRYAQNLFSASRASDPVLLNVKVSLVALFKRSRISTRDQTISGLTVAVALYICLMSFGS